VKGVLVLVLYIALLPIIVLERSAVSTYYHFFLVKTQHVYKFLLHCALLVQFISRGA
jgi:hypothetical protein